MTAESTCTTANAIVREIVGRMNIAPARLELPRRNRNRISELRRAMDLFEQAKKNWDFTTVPLHDLSNQLDNLQFEVYQMKMELERIRQAQTTINREDIVKSIERLLERGARIEGGLYLIVPIPNVKVKVNGQEFLIGDMEVVLTPHLDQITAIRIWNKTRQINGYEHPHVLGGVPCFGQWGTYIMNAWRKKDFEQVVDLITQFLHSYNPESTFLKIAYWGENYVEYCDDCECPVNECECEEEDYDEEDEDEEEDEDWS